MPHSEQLESAAAALGLQLSLGQRNQLMDYLALIQKWNRVYNLTAVRDPAEMLTHHLLDSLAVVAPLQRHTQGKPARLLDVGSGAGLPGVVLAIVCPELDVTCVDTVGKKAAFIQNVANALKLPTLRGVHARVEELKAKPFDIVTSRAFSSLVDFVTWTGFHVKQSDSEAATTSQAGCIGTTSQADCMGNTSQAGCIGNTSQAGVWMAMKGKHPTDELTALPATVNVFHVEPLVVPGLDAERCLVWMRVK